MRMVQETNGAYHRNPVQQFLFEDRADTYTGKFQTQTTRFSAYLRERLHLNTFGFNVTSLYETVFTIAHTRYFLDKSEEKIKSLDAQLATNPSRRKMRALNGERKSTTDLLEVLGESIRQQQISERGLVERLHQDPNNQLDPKVIYHSANRLFQQFASNYYEENKDGNIEIGKYKKHPNTLSYALLVEAEAIYLKLQADNNSQSSFPKFNT